MALESCEFWNFYLNDSNLMWNKDELHLKTEELSFYFFSNLFKFQGFQGIPWKSLKNPWCIIISLSLKLKNNLENINIVLALNFEDFWGQGISNLEKFQIPSSLKTLEIRERGQGTLTFNPSVANTTTDCYFQWKSKKLFECT